MVDDYFDFATCFYAKSGVRAYTPHEMPGETQENDYNLDIWIALPDDSVWVGTVFTCDDILRQLTSYCEDSIDPQHSFWCRGYVVVDKISLERLRDVVEEMVECGSVYTAFVCARL